MNKKVQVFLLLFVAMLGTVHSQYIGVLAVDGSNHGGGHTIVRSWNSQYVVSYYVDVNLEPTIDMVDGNTGMIYRAKLPSFLYINDMYIDKTTDILYFCGATRFIFFMGHV